MNAGGFGRGGGGAISADVLRIEAGGNDPVTGESFAAIAGRSRAMHKTQGFGNFGGGGGGARSESFQLLDGEPAAKDILDGVDTTWGRVPGGAEIGKLADEALAQFNPQDPAASVPALLKLRGLASALPATDPVVIEKRAQLDRILQACLGLEVETTIPNAEVVPGEAMKLRHSAIVRSSVPVRWLAVRYPAIKREVKQAIEMHINASSTRDSSETLPGNTLLNQPYWLREEPTAGMFRVDDPALIGRPENPPAFPVEQVFEVGGQTLVVPDEPVQLARLAKGEFIRRLEVVRPVALKFATSVRLFSPGAARQSKSSSLPFAPRVRHSANDGSRRLDDRAGGPGISAGHGSGPCKA